MVLLKKTFILSATAAIAFLFAGCGESKVAQCNKIVAVTNKAIVLGQELSKNTEGKNNSKTLTETASKIDTIASELKALEIKDEKLQGFQGRFLKLYQDTSQGLKDTAKAVDKKALQEANRALAILKKSASDETVLVKEINSYCSAK